MPENAVIPQKFVMHDGSGGYGDEYKIMVNDFYLL